MQTFTYLFPFVLQLIFNLILPFYSIYISIPSLLLHSGIPAHHAREPRAPDRTCDRDRGDVRLHRAGVGTARSAARKQGWLVS